MVALLTLAAVLFPTLAIAVPIQGSEKVKISSHGLRREASLVPFKFTSTYSAYATPDQPVNASNVQIPGEVGAYGTFQYGINAPQDIICWNITVFISGNYSSPAKTATHIHEGIYGRNGPPRLAFPNPTIASPIDGLGRRVSIGCMSGPFTTGLVQNGTDTGANFKLSQIEANPPGFFTDVHTDKHLPGAIRGQLELRDSIYH